MKRNSISALLLVCVLALSMTGCSCNGCAATESAPSFDIALPEIGETCEYTVTKTYVAAKNPDDHKVVARGTYTSALSKSAVDADKSMQLVNTFSLAYDKLEPKTVTKDVLGRHIVNTGLTDSYRATVDFRSESLSPNRGTKEFKIAQRPLCDDKEGHAAFLTDDDKITTDLPEGVLYRYALPDADKYGDPRGYDYTVDYANNKAVLHTTEGKTDAKTHYRDYKSVEKEIKVADNLRWDNEQLALLVRSFANTKKKGGATFYLSSLYDSYTAGRYVRYTMTASCGEKTKDTVLTSVDPAVYILTDKEGECKKTESGKYEVPCLTVTVSVSSDTPGPGIEFLVIDPSITVAKRDTPAIKTSKLIVQMKFKEFDPASVSLAYETLYDLTNYKMGY